MLCRTPSHHSGRSRFKFQLDLAHIPAELRRLLLNAAMSAINTTVWKPLDEQSRTRDWSTTASLVIIARTIALAAWSIHPDHSTVNPERISQCLT